MPRTAGLTRADIEARWQQVVDMTKFGMTLEQIAEQSGFSIPHVRRIQAKLMGPRGSRRPYTCDELERIETMLDDGCSLAEIARTLGRNRHALSRRFAGRGWTRQQVAEWLVLQREIARVSGL